MTRAQYEKELEKLEREADKRGCCVVPAKPLREPGKKLTRRRGEAESAERKRRAK